MINFEIFGYSVDYRLNGRYIGSVTIEKPDRDKMGYYGKKIETLTSIVTGKQKFRS